MAEERVAEPEDGAQALRHYTRVRSLTEALVAPLDPEDTGLQAEPQASPAKWHLAHTTWFFETFLLQPFLEGYTPFHPAYGYLFNSYYEAKGARQPRHRRGELSRPLLREVLAYRAHVDAAMARLLASGRHAEEVATRLQLGLHHEQQHQELFCTDLKVNLGVQPLRPAWRPHAVPEDPTPPPRTWIDLPGVAGEGTLVSVGHDGAGFAFDHEGPRHRVFLRPAQLASRLVTQGEYQAFLDDGGYDTASLWLADGWAWRQEHGITAPRYWFDAPDGTPSVYTLHGPVLRDPHAPVCHVSGYEAEAYAAWAGARLPLEHEWEVALADRAERDADHLLDADGFVQPRRATAGPGLRQAWGTAWCWTRSSFLPYPGFQPLPGTLGEYNGKFMSGQWVLRGGSVATPRQHLRPTYRNFFYPQQRWQFTGIRLARETP